MALAKEQLQEIKDSWADAEFPDEGEPIYRTVGEPTLSLAKADILALIAEVERLWAYRERITQVIINLPMPTF